MPTYLTPLTLAFVHQSLAAAKNHVRAQRAAKDGQPEAAQALRALAEAQEVHAKKALTFLRGQIGKSSENLALALQEAREHLHEVDAHVLALAVVLGERV